LRSCKTLVTVMSSWSYRRYNKWRSEPMQKNFT
jgi:hypothetical protein